MKICLASRLFPEAERDWVKMLKWVIKSLAGESGRTVQMIWPYEDIPKRKSTLSGNRQRMKIFLSVQIHLRTPVL